VNAAALPERVSEIVSLSPLRADTACSRQKEINSARKKKNRTTKKEKPLGEEVGGSVDVGRKGGKKEEKAMKKKMRVRAG
jgi:hypothetical protein